MIISYEELLVQKFRIFFSTVQAFNMALHSLGTWAQLPSALLYKSEKLETKCEQILYDTY
jgi:hypothetical protein